MKKHLIIPFLLISFFLFRCNNAPEEAGTEQMPVSNEATEEAGMVTPMESEAMEAEVQPEMPQPAATAEVALNPAHGEPGHRCDIAVGAPLNSAPSGPATQEIKMESIQPVEAQAPTQVQAPASVMTAPGMNPPHGEPGHDCSIPVGQPLKK